MANKIYLYLAVDKIYLIFRFLAERFERGLRLLIDGIADSPTTRHPVLVSTHVSVD